MAAVLLIAPTGCGDGRAPDYPPVEGISADNTATVRRGTIVSVVTANGSVVATPEYAVLSRVSGRVRFTRTVKKGKSFKAGKVLAWQGTTKLSAPTGGALVRHAIYDGMRVEAGVPVAIIRFGGFAVQADLPAAQAFRLNDGVISVRAQVTGGPGPTACNLVPTAEPAGLSGADSGAAAGGGETTGDTAGSAQRTLAPVRLLCLLPRGTTLRAGLPAVLGLNTGEQKNALLVPAQAVAGDTGSGVVTRLVDGRPVETAVKLGITDGVDVQILSGLKEGDQILAYGPHLRIPVR